MDDTFQVFAKIQKEIEALGYSVINPHDVCRRAKKNKDQSKEEYFKECLRLCLCVLPLADVVVTIPGWEESKESTIQVEIARKTGFIEVEFSVNFIRRHNGELN